MIVNLMAKMNRLMYSVTEISTIMVYFSSLRLVVMKTSTLMYQVIIICIRTII